MIRRLRPLKFLIVEDNGPFADLLRRLLRGLGVRDLRWARNGEDGKRMALVYKPDIIIVDYRMTPTNGLEFTRWLRRDRASPIPEAPVIGLGHGFLRQSGALFLS